MASYIAIILSSISIILLMVVIIKFKKLFSTESIIEKTKLQMNKIISDINKNANMDIDLINDATKRTRTLLKETDEKMEEFKEASKLLRDMIATVESKSFTSFNSNSIYNDSNGKAEKLSNSFINDKKLNGENTKKISNYSNTFNAKAYKSQQQSLFEEDASKLENKDNLIPKIVTNIIPGKDENKKSINIMVENLFNKGMQVEDIALELSCSVSEVQFIVDMLTN